MKKENLIRSSLIASTIATVFVVIITIAGELYKVTDAAGKSINPIKEFLKALHGHHWVGKGVWAVGIFFIAWVVFYLLDKNNDESTEPRLSCYAQILMCTLIIGTIALYGFFTYEFVIRH